MRGLIVMTGIMIALALGAWIYMDAWIGVLFFALAVGVLFTIIRHALTLAGGGTFQQDEATARIGIVTAENSTQNTDHGPQ